MPIKGLLAAIAAFMFWGGFPIFWQLLKHVPSFEILMHRIIWAAVFMTLWLSIGKQWPALRNSLKTDRTSWLYCGVAAILIGINWFIYLSAVNNNQVVQTSLGYYIGPLLNVLLGLCLFKEQLRRGQWLALGCACAGVAYLVWQQHSVPWYALGVAVSFSLYGAIKKYIPLSASASMWLESTLLMVPALIAVSVLHHHQGHSAFIDSNTDAITLIIGGVITAIPMLLFSYGAKRIPLSIMGFIQYLGPSLQLAVGVLYLHESFDQTRIIGFSLVWLALVILSVEGVYCRNQRD